MAKRNRYIAQCDNSRSHTWSVIDRETGKKVREWLLNRDEAKWAALELNATHSAIERDRLFGLNDPPWQIINRATWCRGERQRIALAHLKQRGLFLDKEHRLRAGLEAA